MKCKICGLDKEQTEFYPLRKGFHGDCKKCQTQKTLYRQYNIKKESIDYKGGKCIKCGYNKCLAAMEFHHRDPAQKEFGIARFSGTALENPLIKQELDKCDLLCANCHRETHCLESEQKILNMIVKPKQEPLPPKFCSCGKQICNISKRCVTCHNRNKSHVNWPSDQELIELIKNMPMTKVAKQIGVSDNGVKKHCKMRGIRLG